MQWMMSSVSRVLRCSDYLIIPAIAYTGNLKTSGLTADCCDLAWYASARRAQSTMKQQLSEGEGEGRREETVSLV